MRFAATHDELVAIFKELAAVIPAGDKLSVQTYRDWKISRADWGDVLFVPQKPAALDDASKALFGKPAAYMGEGGTIPFMSMLGTRFPDAQMLVTGVLGPKSNAHGPNEFIDIGYAKRVCSAVARIIATIPAASTGRAR